MDNNIDKRIVALRDRLTYLKDIFAGKNLGDSGLLEDRLEAFATRVREGTLRDDPYAELSSIEDLFGHVERRLDKRITAMDKVRIVRHPQRICLRDILENVYDNFTEVGGQDEYSLDPGMLIARAVIMRRSGKKTYAQAVMVIGQEKGHGAEYRNGGSVKPWGNAKALRYMHVAETEGIPIHSYIFTPGAYPIEDYPGAAQQIARNIYGMAGLRVPIVSVTSEGGSGGAEAIDRRLMLSHGYYSVISPEGAAAIEGHIKAGQRATPEMIEHCAENLHITAQDNLRFGYIDRIIEEPPLGARPWHFDFFRTLFSMFAESNDYQMITPSFVNDTEEKNTTLNIPWPISSSGEEKDTSEWIGNELQQEAFDQLFKLEGLYLESANETAKLNWLRLQAADHFNFMNSKWLREVAVRRNFDVYPSPYQAFINYMNVLNDVKIQLSEK